MRDYSWSPDFTAVVSEIDDAKLFDSVNRVESNLRERLLQLIPQNDRDERPRIIHALETLAALRRERLQRPALSAPHTRAAKTVSTPSSPRMTAKST